MASETWYSLCKSDKGMVGQVAPTANPGVNWRLHVKGPAWVDERTDGRIPQTFDREPGRARAWAQEGSLSAWQGALLADAATTTEQLRAARGRRNKVVPPAVRSVIPQRAAWCEPPSPVPAAGVASHNGSHAARMRRRARRARLRVCPWMSVIMGVCHWHRFLGAALE
ncbi:hypothetical protein ACCO45_003902 [Purpureocillium lilacinum]|uniref:Uncharacterized protein n=2 Tax=Purpureocillium lilacinum TaxID=33203 RepID=A0ACC4E2M2_PURLI|nr:hypothetical protein Purlil1_7781 [Purpureocillium lilacinum]